MGLIKPNAEYEVIGGICENGYFDFKIPEDSDVVHCGKLKGDGHLDGGDWTVVLTPKTQTPNRDYLRDFCNMNNIKKTLVSLALGKSENWLTQTVNDKRRDMTDATLKSILSMLHIQWDSTEVLNVKAHDGCSAYTTVPSTYTTTAHKERLQRSFWRGMVK